jgi:heme/copper-type cytochrome/quinol oxidase subunit 3
VATALGLAGLFIGHLAYRALGLKPAADAYGSIVLSLFGFEGLVVALTVAMLLLGQLWAWRAAHDPRGHAVVFNTALVGGFAALGSVILFAMVYVAPRLG